MGSAIKNEFDLEHNPNVSSTGDEGHNDVPRVSPCQVDDDDDDDDDDVAVDRMEEESNGVEEKVSGLDLNLNVPVESNVFISTVKDANYDKSRVLEVPHLVSERDEAGSLSEPVVGAEASVLFGQAEPGADIDGENSGTSGLLSEVRSVKAEEMGNDAADAATQETVSGSSEVLMHPPPSHRGRLDSSHSTHNRPPVGRFDAPHLDADTRDAGYGFHMGDMVWGKVKSHPWWPGQIFNEAFASPTVRRAKKDGHVLVAFYGDSSYGWFDPAELIPYEPNFPEKCKQIHSRRFLKAVEESADEAGRRSALGLSCFCKNPFIFRPTICRGYLAVDVPEYEGGGIYSVTQIRKAREKYNPAETLSVIKQLAQAPTVADSGSLEFVKGKAAAVAYRRKVYEDFDPTYALAFGHQPVVPAPLPPKPPRVPLSGPQVFQEALGGRKSSTKPPKSKDNTKRDRYLLKRREERSEARTPQRQTSSSSSSAYEDGPSDSDYVLQRRDQYASVVQGEGVNCVSSEVATSSGAGGEATAERSIALKPQIVVADESTKVESDASTVSTTLVGDLGGLIGTSCGTAENIPSAVKRSAEDLSTDQSVMGQKKKKKRKKDPVKNADPLHRHTAEAKSKGAVVKMPEQVLQNLSNGAGQDRVDLSELLADLRSLAQNQFHGVTSNKPSVVRQIFLRFRSLVFQKSLAVSPPAELEVSESQPARAAPAPPAENVVMPPPKRLKPLASTDDSSKSGKRLRLSDRQEQGAAKKAKRIADAKSSGAERRSIKKTSEVQRSADGKGKANTVLSRPAKGDSMRRLQAPKVEEPTYLVMKYPPGSSLPTATELKARFVRFGSMDISATRVFYKSSTCRVVFRYRQDADAAYRYAVGNKTIFSGVRFQVRAVASADDGLTEQPPPMRESAPDSRSGAHSFQKPQQLLPRIQSPAMQLKSCMKKPAGDEFGQGAGSARGVRVRFNVGEDSGASGVHLMEVRNNSSFPDAGPSSVAMDVSSSNQMVISAQRPLTPNVPFSPQFSKPPATTSQPHVETVQRPNQNYNLTQAAQASHEPKPDISQQMMMLLTRCHDVVSNVRSMLGYVPYHPL